MSTIDTSYDADLANDHEQLFRTRTAIKGQYYVKQAGTKLLPDPNEDPKGKDNAKYQAYKQRAEFDDYTAKTEKSILGKLDADKLDADLDPQLDYLISNADGDGLSLAGYVENVYKNNLSDKYCIGIVHHGGLMSLDVSELSAEEVEQNSIKPSMKLYTRESIVKRDFSVINGRKQLSMIMFYECAEELDKNTFARNKVESYLICALDEDGHYYQQKIIKDDAGNGNNKGERKYISINDEPVKSIPAYIFSDTETQTELPCGFGFLTPIAEICYYLYSESADKKAAMAMSVPTINMFGFDEHNAKVFEQVNGYYKIGDVNMLPEGCTVENTVAGTNFDYFENYEESMIEKARSIGAVIPKKQGENKTATEAVINAGEQNEVLTPMVDNVERGIKWLIAYCGMFLGVYNQDQLEEIAGDIDLTLNREFIKMEPDAQLLQVMLDLNSAGMMRRESIVGYLVSVGLESGEIADIIQELDNQAPVLLPSSPQDAESNKDEERV